MLGTGHCHEGWPHEQHGHGAAGRTLQRSVGSQGDDAFLFFFSGSDFQDTFMKQNMYVYIYIDRERERDM